MERNMLSPDELSLDCHPDHLLVTVRGDTQSADGITGHLHEVLNGSDDAQTRAITLELENRWSLSNGDFSHVLLYTLQPQGDASEFRRLQRVLRAVTQLQSHIHTAQDAGGPLHRVTPNWTTGGAQIVKPDGVADGLIFGGPAGPPEWLAQKHYRFRTPDLHTEGEDVDVYVLDTSPNLKRHRGGSELLAGIGTSYLRGDVHSQDHWVGWKNNEGRYHGRLIPNHGLFVSSLIHSIAPRSRIRLVRVLNDYGAGNVATLLTGLEEVQRQLDISGRSAVLNLSLFVAPPRVTAAYLASYNLDHLAHRLPIQSGSDPAGLYEDDTSAIAALHAKLNELRERFQQRLIIVASAGNDGQGRGPRLPAGLVDSVVSVAAVDAHGLPALYSNNGAVAAGTNGIATYGGNYDPHSEHNDDRVVGLYPTFDADGSLIPGYARWSGTSFAAGFISGLCAKVLAADLPGNGVATAPNEIVETLVASVDRSQRRSNQLNCPVIMPDGI